MKNKSSSLLKQKNFYDNKFCFLADAQGTFFIQKDPRECLSPEEFAIYFLGEPGIGSPEDKETLLGIIKKLHLEKEAEAIMQEENFKNYPEIKKLFYLGDRLAEEYFQKIGMDYEESQKFRGQIASKVYALRNPEIFHNFADSNKNMNMNIILVSQAGQYMKYAFEKLLKDSGNNNVNVVIAPGLDGTRYTKMQPEFYQLLKKKYPSMLFIMVDDNTSRVDPAKQAGIYAVLYEEGKDGDKNSTKLLEVSNAAIKDSVKDFLKNIKTYKPVSGKFTTASPSNE